MTELSKSQIPLEVRLALTTEEIDKACELRYEVFVKEENAKLGNSDCIENDQFDKYCDHLIVLRKDTAEVVGTYRLMTGKQALSGIGFYSETEFDLSGFRQWFPYTVELGRSCVKKEFRSGRVISLLWEGIGRYVFEKDVQHLIGCASIPSKACDKISDIYSFLKNNYYLDGTNINPLPDYQIEGLVDTVKGVQLSESGYHTNPKELFRKLPPLIKGYLRMGAYICCEPAYDPVFGTFDFFMFLDRSNIVKRYRNSYLKAV